MEPAEQLAENEQTKMVDRIRRAGGAGAGDPGNPGRLLVPGFALLAISIYWIIGLLVHTDFILTYDHA